MKKLLTYLRSVFRPSVDRIIADFDRTKAKLLAHEAKSLKAIGEHLDLKAAIDREVDRLNAEAERARKVADNIAAITSA